MHTHDIYNSALNPRTHKLINVFIISYFFMSHLVIASPTLDNVALETQKPSTAADEGAFRIVQSTDGDRHLWEAVRNGDGSK